MHRCIRCTSGAFFHTPLDRVEVYFCDLFFFPRSTQAELDEAKGVRDKEHQEYLVRRFADWVKE